MFMTLTKRCWLVDGISGCVLQKEGPVYTRILGTNERAGFSTVKEAKKEMRRAKRVLRNTSIHIVAAF